jgi:hypothetical protein
MPKRGGGAITRVDAARSFTYNMEKTNKPAYMCAGFCM